MFARMDGIACDWWGDIQAEMGGYPPHNQSFWQVFRAAVLKQPWFSAWFDRVEAQPSVDDVIRTYEVGLSVYLRARGLRYASYVDGVFHDDAFAGGVKFMTAFSPCGTPS